MTYSTGKAAMRLNVSPHSIRRLCEAGVIKGAVLSDGNRWRIPTSEIDRLRVEGVPPIPQVDRESERPVSDRQSADPSPAPSAAATRPVLISEDTAPEVRQEIDQYAVVETRLKRRKVELELEGVEDSFRERERRQAAETEEQRRKEAFDQAEAARSKWMDVWIRYALSKVPDDARACRLEVYQAAEHALRTIRPDVPDRMVQKFMDDAVFDALAPYRRAQDLDQAVSSAINEALPYNARVGREGVEAKRVAREAAQAFPDADAMRVAARAAVAPIAAGFRDRQVRQEILASTASPLWLLFANPTEQDREAARKAVQEALGRFPVGTPGDRLKRAAEDALKPLEGVVRERHAKKEARRDAERTADGSLWLVGSYLDAHFEFTSYAERAKTERELKAELRESLIARLVRGKLTAVDVSNFIEAWLEDRFEDEEDEEDEE